jgi:ubiquitin carboxyl-terminal hydrolase L3
MAESKGPTKTYRKHYLPLESNPELFTQLINSLGVTSLEFQDVYSIDEPDLLAIVARPVYALVLVFPTTPVYEEQIAKEEAARDQYTGSGAGEDVIWFQQTINNACGLYGILHAVSNGDARNFIGEMDCIEASTIPTLI